MLELRGGHDKEWPSGIPNGSKLLFPVEPWYRVQAIKHSRLYSCLHTRYPELRVQQLKIQLDLAMWEFPTIRGPNIGRE